MPWNYIATTKQLHNKKRHLTFILWLLILSRHRSFFHCFHNNKMYIKLWIWTCMFYNRLIKWSLSQFNCWYITERDAITAMCRIWCSHTRIGPVFVITLEFGLFSGECYHFRKHESFNRNFNRPISTYTYSSDSQTFLRNSNSCIDTLKIKWPSFDFPKVIFIHFVWFYLLLFIVKKIDYKIE